MNKQTKNKFINACDLLNESVLEEIGPTFAKNHRKLMPGHVYFLNRQLLGKGKTLSNEVEGTRSFYDVLNDTIEDTVFIYICLSMKHIEDLENPAVTRERQILPIRLSMASSLMDRRILIFQCLV